VFPLVLTRQLPKHPRVIGAFNPHENYNKSLNDPMIAAQCAKLGNSIHIDPLNVLPTVDSL
jgi:hypothetical protein